MTDRLSNFPRLSRAIPGRRTGRRVTTTTSAMVGSWPSLTTRILVRPGMTLAWNLPREYTVVLRDDGTFGIIHEWSRK